MAASVPSAGTNLRQRAGYAWRLLATGLCFAGFGLGGCLLGFSLFPLLRLTSRQPAVVRRRIQRAMSRSFRLFVWTMKSLGLLSYEVRGRERLLRRGQLVVANHPSLIDVVFLISLMPEVDCIVKQALWRNPFLRWPVLWAGYISNSKGDELVADCSRSLAQGNSLIVFPEGTRSVPGHPLAMQRGAAQIAISSGADIVPVTITCAPSTLTKAERWYQIPSHRPHWILSVGEPFRGSSLLDGSEAAPIAARKLTRHFKDYFSHSVARQLRAQPRSS